VRSERQQLQRDKRTEPKKFRELVREMDRAHNEPGIVRGRPVPLRPSDQVVVLEHEGMRVGLIVQWLDDVLELDADDLEPMITWGTNPGMGIPVTGRVPDPGNVSDPIERESFSYIGEDYLLAVNYPEGTVQGWEVEARKSLDFLLHLFDARPGPILLDILRA
jgi:hypothetical protein